MSFQESLAGFARTYKAPLILAGATLAEWALGSALLEPNMAGSDYQYTWRFAPYTTFALAGAEASKTFWERKLGRGLNLWEKCVAYTAGAATASLGFEAWEHFGQHLCEPLQSLETTVGAPDVIKEHFYGQGSATDAATSAGIALGTEGIKELVKKPFRAVR